MRSLILAALLALPVTAIALPVNETFTISTYNAVGKTEMVLIVTQNRVVPVRDMDALSRAQRADVEVARQYAEEQGNAYRVEMPADGKCHQL